MPFTNIPGILDYQASGHGDRPFVRFRSGEHWVDWSYAEVRRRAGLIAGALADLGIQRGDRVAIIAENGPQWTLADLASLAAGAVVVSIYSTLPANEIHYLLEHSESRIVFAGDDSQVEKVLSVRSTLPHLQRIIAFDGTPPREGLLTMSDLEARGATSREKDRFGTMARELTRDDLAAITYTSGTTGKPKGVILTHGNVLSTIEMSLESIPTFGRFTLNLSFLPLAHVLERFGGHFVPLFLGGTIAHARSIDTVGEDIVAVKPHFFISVPRVLEKIHSKIESQVALEKPSKQRIFNWAVGVGRKRSDAIENHRRVPIGTAVAFFLASRLVFSKIRKRVGGRLELVLCGGAPLSPEVARFFHSVGIMVVEGWGLTETCAPTTVNTLTRFKFGSVGLPLPGCSIKVAEDGELLVRGPNVFTGYFKNPEATREAFDENGYFRTGDIGRIDEEGFCYITDRKKELIVTSAGKNIAPQKIEKLLRDETIVANCLVHGDRRNYLVALIAIDRDAIRARIPDVADAPPDDPALRALVDMAVQRVNAELPRFEQIKYFRIVDRDFTAEGGELTVTLKLKRRAVESRYQRLLDEMYVDGAKSA